VNERTAIDKTTGEVGIVRQGFGESSIERRGETAATMVAAQAQAEIQARYVMALQRPRDDDNVRVRLLRECKRPNFARAAFYSLPRGDKPGRLTGTPNRIEGLTVRFAEAAIRLSGNIFQSTRTIYDDDYKRMVNVAATDLETNAVYSRDVMIEKTVERSKPKDKAVILGSRTNSAGHVVYIVQATDDELLQKESALVSKTFRTLGLRLIPADVLEECERAIVATLKTFNESGFDDARKSVADAFSTLSVMPSDLKEYLGHELGQCSPAELVDLRGLYEAIREGDITWGEVMAEKRNAIATEGTGETEGASKTKAQTVAGKVKAKAAEVEARRAEKQTAANPPPTPTPATPEREPGQEG
jgi:hypothetical protein